MFCLNVFTTQCCMFAGVLIEDAVFYQMQRRLFPHYVPVPLGFRLVLRYCCYPANLLFSGVFCYDFRWDTVLLHYLYQLVCFRVWFLFMFRPLTLYLSRVTFLADFTLCGTMSHRVLTSWVVCDMLHLWFRSVFAT